MMKDRAKESIGNLIENQESFFLSLSNISVQESNLNCIDGQIIGTGRADYTQSSTEYNLIVDDKEFLLIDIPGIEGDESKYREIIKESLMKAHVIFYVNGSGKKAERDTLEKIKDYMHDGTSVYAVFNVHCKPQKERIKGLDKTYQEELIDAYKKQNNEIVPQTEEELKSFLGNNFKGSVCINGLLSFCAMALDDYGTSTIVKDDNKNLRETQYKFLNEYSNDLIAMRRDSAVHEVQDIIGETIIHFHEYILEENLKKLRMRLSDMLSDITLLRSKEKTKIKNFLKEYDTFEQNCETAKEDFVQTIKSIGRVEVETAFDSVQNELFDEIERCKGKINKTSIEQILNQHKDQISDDIQSAINKKIKTTLDEYQKSIQDAEERLFKDLKRDQKKFEISMKADKMHFNSPLSDGYGLEFKDITKSAFKLVGYTFTGFSVGSVFPVIGNALGAVAGFILGGIMLLWEFFASEDKRINKAKEKMKQTIDEQIDIIVNDIKFEIEKLEMTDKIEVIHDDLKNRIDVQKKSLRDIERMLDVVVLELNKRYKQI